MTSLKRIFNAGMKSFWRNGSVSLASILIMVVTLSVVMSLLLVSALLNSTLNGIKNRVDINVYFKTTSDEGQILGLKRSLESVDGVASVFYTSRDQALQNFKDRHQGEDDQVLLSALDELGDNPLRASLTIKATEPGKFEAIAKALDTMNTQMGDASILEKVNYPENKAAIDSLSGIIKATNELGLVLAIFFAIIAVLITFNTIRLAIYTSRDEIAVMRLVGASKGYIRGPFLIAGIMYGVISTAFVVLMFLPITIWLGPITEAIGTGINLNSYYLSHIAYLAFVVLISSIIISTISGLLAIKRYLKI